MAQSEFAPSASQLVRQKGDIQAESKSQDVLIVNSHLKQELFRDIEARGVREDKPGLERKEEEAYDSIEMEMR